MKNRKDIAFGVVTAALSAGVAVLGYLYVDTRGKLDSARRAAEEQRLLASRAAPPPPSPGRAAATVHSSAPQPAPLMKVLSAKLDGRDNSVLHVTLSEPPDLEAVRRYVTVEPLASGDWSFTYEWNWRTGAYRPELCISGDFPYETNVVLRIRRGFPIVGVSDGALEEDFTYTFRRAPLRPYVTFAEDGRYLPPGGRGAVELESVNVTNIHTTICRVEPRNVVYMLAREEEVKGYDGWWRGTADTEDTQCLAGEPVVNDFAVTNRINEKALTPVPVRVDDGKPSRGIFLLSAVNSAKPICNYDSSYEPSTYNLERFRLVCFSDLGLSVRKWENDGLGVWVTSLTTGRPVADAWVEVYSTANILVMRGRADANGWCRPERVDKGEPFAVVAIAPDAVDMTFMALRKSMTVDEQHPDGARPSYLGAGETEAFLWTERGIYRHGEPIRLNCLLRDGGRKAPEPMPVEFVLKMPSGRPHSTVTLTSDDDGAIAYGKFSVPDECPSGTWRLEARVPGNEKAVLGEREVKIEEFAPPQIRVTVTPDAASHPSNFSFSVSAEHLFGGPAEALRCEGAVVFEDVPFAPPEWKGWTFGDEERGLKPCYRKLAGGALDAKGEISVFAPLFADTGLPRAAVRATGQGTVFEDGGRPATMRASVTLHAYPYYIGAQCPDTLRLESGRFPRLPLVCVGTDGRRIAAPETLELKVDRIDTVYSCRIMPNGWHTWDCNRVRRTVRDWTPFAAGTNADLSVELPVATGGDYVVTVRDPATDVSFAKSVFLCEWGDATVRAPLANPTAVAIAADKAHYRVGECPRLTVKSPFAGFALVSVMREGEAYTEIRELPQPTSEIVLRPVTAADAPNLDVYVSVVQGVSANAKHFASRAKGQVTLGVRPAEEEIPVKLSAETARGGDLVVTVSAPGGDFASVSVVDEAINLLTDEPTPDPVGHFARLRGATHPLCDLYHKILPVVGGEGLRANGVKTGGGFGAEMLGRVSMVPSRRFRPLALWEGRVALTNGSARLVFPLADFAGEVRVTAVAYGASSSGAASLRRKVTPKLVMLPDAPRFVAPGDVFEVSMPVYNRSGETAKFGWQIACGGKTAAFQSIVSLPKDGSTNVVVRLTAPESPGELEIRYRVRGKNELHDRKILLPVRPAVAWTETSGVKVLAPGEEPEETPDTPTCRTVGKVYDSPLGKLSDALAYLAEYPHGCLEQTTSRIFPLISAGGILAAPGVTPVTNVEDCIAAGVSRVASMMRAEDFVMWPDCNYAPWDEEVAVYAAHFLVEAERTGRKVDGAAMGRVKRMLRWRALSTNDAVSVYACLSLALAGSPDKDRMYRLYDARERLSLLSRARLARAFTAVHERAVAEELLKNAASPASVKEAAFALMALLEIDPADPRVAQLFAYLNDHRDAERFSWGTTDGNAHALLALGEYYRYFPPAKGERIYAWRRLSLPAAADVRDDESGLRITRRLLTAEGEEADLGALRRGQLLVAELTVTADDTRTLNDLVVEDLFPGALEPVRGGMMPHFAEGPDEIPAASWVMRSDVRDDRMLVFSKRFALERGQAARFRYLLRAVSAGEYALPGPSVEAMYQPALHARRAPSRLTVR